MKTTFQASPDIALVKYWGKKDEVLRLPENGSVSMVLDGLFTKTTVEFEGNLTSDEVLISGEVEEGEASRVIKHLDRIRDISGTRMRAKVVSENNFPKGTGLSSSGSGFAALTYAGCKAAGLNLSEKELSILARQGSGTACRCVCSGFVEWKDGNTSDKSFSETIYPFKWWDIKDVIAVVDDAKKLVSSTSGHALAHTSIFYESRLKLIGKKIEAVKRALGLKDFRMLGEIVEAEALEFHSVLLTSQPSMIAWYPGSIEVMLATQAMRKDGIEAYFTINTGFNVHVLTLPQFEEEVKRRLESLPLVKRTILACAGDKPKEIMEHLF